jgi:hypothetical protein
VVSLLVPFIVGILVFTPSMSYIADVFHNGYDGGYFAHYGIYFTRWTDLTGYDGGFTPGHLWFLLFLFLYSLLLPLILLLTKKLSKLKPSQWLASLRHNAVVLLLLFFVPFVAQPIGDIGGRSLGEYFAFFLIGYFVFSDAKCIDVLQKYSILALVGFVASLTAVVLSTVSVLPNSGILYDLYVEAYAYFFIVLILVFMRRFFNHRTAASSYFSGAAQSIYYFHQTWLVAAGFFIFMATDNRLLQIILMAISTFGLSIASYELSRRKRLLCTLFGIRRRRSR